MLLTEYNEAETMELFKEDGRKEGIDQSRIESIKTVMKKLQYTAKQAMEFLEIPASDQSKYMTML